MTNAHTFCDIQPNASAALFRTQLRITPMITGIASATYTPNLSSSLAKALSLFLTHSFAPSSSLGGGLPPPSTPLPPGS